MPRRCSETNNLRVAACIWYTRSSSVPCFALIPLSALVALDLLLALTSCFTRFALGAGVGRDGCISLASLGAHSRFVALIPLVALVPFVPDVRARLLRSTCVKLPASATVSLL